MGALDEIRLLRSNRDWRGRSRVPRSAEPWTPRRERGQFPTTWARTPLARVARTALRRGALTPLVWSQTRPRVYGADLLAELAGPVVFVANHSSHLDTPLILGSLPGHLARSVAVGAASDYFFDARWRATVTALVFNAFPIERRGTRHSPSLAPSLLDDGWSLLIFPEGTRSHDGWMAPFRLGAGYLCCLHGVPAIPVAVRGSYAAMPRGRAWPLPGRPTVAVRYGRPLHPREGESGQAFTARLERAVARLWAEHEVGWWTSLRAEAQDTLELPRGPEAARWRRVWESTRPLRDPDRPRVWPR